MEVRQVNTFKDKRGEWVGGRKVKTVNLCTIVSTILSEISDIGPVRSQTTPENTHPPHN